MGRILIYSTVVGALASAAKPSVLPVRSTFPARDLIFRV